MLSLSIRRVSRCSRACSGASGRRVARVIDWLRSTGDPAASGRRCWWRDSTQCSGRATLCPPLRGHLVDREALRACFIERLECRSLWGRALASGARLPSSSQFDRRSTASPCPSRAGFFRLDVRVLERYSTNRRDRNRGHPDEKRNRHLAEERMGSAEHFTRVLSALGTLPPHDGVG